jgi:hypothetical protein
MRGGRERHGCARARRRWTARLAALAVCPAAFAAPPPEAGTYVLVPVVTQGEREIDVYAGVASAGAAVAHEADAAAALGAAIGDRWSAELAVRYRQASGAATALDALEWENVVVFAEPGQWIVDVGVALEVESPHDSGEGLLLRAGPLLQKDFGRMQVNFNLLAGRHVGGTEFAATQFEYQGQLKYRYSEPFEFGLQSFGGFSSPASAWAAYASQAHRLGPALFGRAALRGERSISYNAAFLLGTTAHSPDRTLRVQLEYEF